MKRIIQTLLILASLAISYTLLFVYKMPHFLYQQVENYTIQSLEQCYGNQKLEAKHEQFVYQIAHKMGIDEEFAIRKMNWQALQIFGYHNAFVMQSMTFNILPLIDRPYLFISQGFFEDLTVEEQTFLIGHELVHLKERHARYLFVLEIIAFTLLLFFWWIFIRKIIQGWLESHLNASYSKVLMVIVHFIAFTMCDYIPHIIALSYRRQIEWQADRCSLEILNSHDGAVKYLNRIEQEFKAPENNGYMDLFSDHPSNSLRKKYCLEHKQQITE